MKQRSLKGFGGWWLAGVGVGVGVLRVCGEGWEPAMIGSLLLSGIPGGVTVIVIGKRLGIANWDWSGATLIVVLTPVLLCLAGCAGVLSFAVFPYPMPLIVGAVCGWVFGAALTIGGQTWKRDAAVSGLAGAVAGLLTMLDLLIHLVAARRWGAAEPAVAVQTLAWGLAMAQCWMLCRVAARWHPLPGACTECEYDLAGAAGGVCPECGTAADAEGRS